MGFLVNERTVRRKTWVNLWLESILKIGSHVRLVAWQNLAGSIELRRAFLSNIERFPHCFHIHADLRGRGE